MNKLFFHLAWAPDPAAPEVEACLQAISFDRPGLAFGLTETALPQLPAATGDAPDPEGYASGSLTGFLSNILVPIARLGVPVDPASMILLPSDGPDPDAEDPEEEVRAFNIAGTPGAKRFWSVPDATAEALFAPSAHVAIALRAMPGLTRPILMEIPEGVR